MRPPVSDETEVVERVRFAAGPLTLEGRLSYPERAAPRAAVVIAGPHPLWGGMTRGYSCGASRCIGPMRSRPNVEEGHGFGTTWWTASIL